MRRPRPPSRPRRPPGADSRRDLFLIARGLLEHRLDRDDLAIGSLSRAYRASNAAAMAEPHILSASALSVVMRSMGDTSSAALNQEKVDWMPRGAT